MALVNAENGAAILTIAKNGTNNSAPLVNGALDTQLFNELLAGAAAQNTSNYIRDYTAAVLGLLAGTVTLPLGPVVAVGADQAFSNTFKWAYDSARQWSQQLDWSKLWDKIDDLSKPANFVNGDPITGLISPTLGTTPDPLVKSIKYVPVDPLILDLDGDGLEITPLSAGVLFDANADTVKTGTAWAAADDGMLVWDRNGNGSIDSGRELFGDETILANGQKAANGFAALAELDTGSLVGGIMVGAGDGKFDANDAQYANLRVWRDLNQDGISQAGELQTLTQSGVQSISLSSTASNTSYANGNATLVSAAASALSNITGSGWRPRLQEAATLSPKLVALQKNTRKRELQSKSDRSCKLAGTRWAHSQVSPHIRQIIRLLIKKPHHILT